MRPGIVLLVHHLIVFSDFRWTSARLAQHRNDSNEWQKQNLCQNSVCWTVRCDWSKEWLRWIQRQTLMWWTVNISPMDDNCTLLACQCTQAQCTCCSSLNPLSQAFETGIFPGLPLYEKSLVETFLWPQSAENLLTFIVIRMCAVKTLKWSHFCHFKKQQQWPAGSWDADQISHTILKINADRSWLGRWKFVDHTRKPWPL